MKKLLPIVIITLTSLLITKEAWSLPNCSDTEFADYPNLWNNCKGTITFYDGTYIGEWKNGKFDGQGTITDAYGDRYIGEWKNGEFDGQGTKTYSYGDRYVGEWKNGKRNGQGTLFYIDGGKYVGEWQKDEWHGQGSLHYSDGRKSVGEFKNNKLMNVAQNTPSSNIVEGFFNALFSSSSSSSSNSGSSPYNSNTPSFNSNSSSGFTTTFGNTYQYDLSNPVDRVKYNSDPNAKLRDSIGNQYIKEFHL